MFTTFGFAFVTFISKMRVRLLFLSSCGLHLGGHFVMLIEIFMHLITHLQSWTYRKMVMQSGQQANKRSTCGCQSTWATLRQSE